MLQLPGSEKPTVVVKCCPIPFVLKPQTNSLLTRYVSLYTRVAHVSYKTSTYLLWISLCFEHSVGACMGSLWFVCAIDLY